MKIEIRKVHPAAEIPKPATLLSAAVDLRAMIDSPLTIRPFEDAALIPTGLAINLSSGTVAAMILPRSGLGHKKGLVLGNLVGLIDGDYQGELFISAWNRSLAAITINPGERIAQMMFVPVIRSEFVLVEEFSAPTERGEGGFGSTGD